MIEYKYKIIYLFIALELFINTYNGMSITRDAKDYHQTKSVAIANEKAVKFIKNYDDSFYRMEFAERTTSNDSMLHDYKGINFFSSVYNSRIINFLREKLELTSTTTHKIIIDDMNPALLSFFNIKYTIGNFDYLKEVKADGIYSIYENKHPLSLGFMVAKDYANIKLSKNKLHNYNQMYQADLFHEITSKSLILKMDNIEETEEIIFVDNLKSNPYKLVNKNNKGFLHLEYEAKNDVLLMNINQFKNLDKVLINDEDYEFNNYIPLKVKDKVEMIYQISEEISEVENSLIILNVENYELAVAELGTNLLEVKTNSKHLVEGNVKSTEDKSLLFLSIPYEEGFIIKVDGMKIKPIMIFNTFLGLELSEGEHQITIDYFPKGLAAGLIITLSSLVIFIGYYCIDKGREVNKVK